MPTLLLLLLSCVPRSQVRALEAQVAALDLQLTLTQTQVVALEAQVAECSEALAKTPDGRPSALDEEEAMRLFNEINEALEENRVVEARELVGMLLEDHPRTRVASRAIRIQQELDVIGKAAPQLEVREWLQGERAGWGRTTLVVFFEVWCPHCQREVPKLEAYYRELGPRGLDVVALTRLTKSATLEKAEAFIEEKELSFPVAVEQDGSMTEYFNVSGIPAAAIVQDGEIIWRGHPARLTEGYLAELL